MVIKERESINMYAIIALYVLMIAGSLIMIYFITEKYFIKSDESSNYVCDISTKFSCSYVSQSSYSYLFGVHVSVYGLIWYLLMIIGLSLLFKIPKQNKRILRYTLFAISFFGLIFSLYLQLVEVFILKTYCIFCLTSFAIITIILVLYYRFIFLKIST